MTPATSRGSNSAAASSSLLIIQHRSLTREEFHRQIKEVDAESERGRGWKIALRCLIGSTFGAIHCTAWNFFFSTFAESVTWRVASALTVVIPFVFALEIIKSRMPNWKVTCAGVLILVYIPVRLYLIVEPFAAFRSVQVGNFYSDNWSTWIPHV